MLCAECCSLVFLSSSTSHGAFVRVKGPGRDGRLTSLCPGYKKCTSVVRGYAVFRRNAERLRAPLSLDPQYYIMLWCMGGFKGRGIPQWCHETSVSRIIDRLLVVVFPPLARKHGSFIWRAFLDKIVCFECCWFIATSFVRKKYIF